MTDKKKQAELIREIKRRQSFEMYEVRQMFCYMPIL